MQEPEEGGRAQDIELALDFPPDCALPPAEAPRTFFHAEACGTRVSTRQVASGGDKRRARAHDVATVAYNVVNEPWVKYVPAYVADRGYKVGQFTAARFHKEALYLETAGCAHRTSTLGPQAPALLR